MGGCLIVTSLKSKGKGFQHCVKYDFKPQKVGKEAKTGFLAQANKIFQHIKIQTVKCLCKWSRKSDPNTSVSRHTRVYRRAHIINLVGSFTSYLTLGAKGKPEGRETRARERRIIQNTLSLPGIAHAEDHCSQIDVWLWTLQHPPPPPPSHEGIILTQDHMKILSLLLLLSLNLY